MQSLGLKSSIGPEEDNDPEDVSNTATALVALGHWDAIDAARSGQHDDAFDQEIRSYQQDNQLDDDGMLLPSGPTQVALNRSLSARPLGPSLLDTAIDERRRIATAKAGIPPNTTWAVAGRLRGDRSAASGRDDTSVDHFLLPHAATWPRISKLAEPNKSKFAEISRRASNLTGSMLDRSDSGTAPGPDFEQIMSSRGYKYIPDPMGRIGEGDWADASGRRVDAREVARLTAISLPRASNRLATDPRPEWRSTVSRINAVLREGVVANALDFRTTERSEISEIVARAANDARIDRRDARSGIRSMLLAAANTAPSTDRSIHARGLLAVYDMEKDNAEREGAIDPYEFADREIAGFIARQSGTLPWSVAPPYVDEGGIEEANDDPENRQSKKPRGTRDPAIRQSIIRGREEHERFYDALRRKDLPADEYIENPKTGKRDLKPDGQIDKGKPLELKPDTESGRAAGRRQIAKYDEATGKRGRVLYYSPDRRYEGWRGGLGGPPRVGGTVEAAGAPSAAFGPIRAPAFVPEAIQPRPAPSISVPRTSGFGMGGGSLYPKLHPPFYLRHMWDMLE